MLTPTGPVTDFLSKKHYQKFRQRNIGEAVFPCDGEQLAINVSIHSWKKACPNVYKDCLSAVGVWQDFIFSFSVCASVFSRIIFGEKQLKYPWWVDIKNVIYTYNWVWFSLEKEGNSDIGCPVIEPQGHYAKWTKPVYLNKVPKVVKFTDRK